MTADDGRIVVGEHLRGALWAGTQLRPQRRELVVLIRRFPYADGKAVIDEWLRYDVPGIAPLAFLGYPDGDEITAAQYAALRRANQPTPPVLVAEIRPEGLPLADAAPLTDGEVVRLAISLCDTVVAWGERRAHLSAGFCPETVYVAGERGRRCYAGATPRVFVMGDDGGAGDAQIYVSPLAPGLCEATVADATFMISQVIWFAATREHAYILPDRKNGRWNMEEDRKRPFTGPRALGELLDRVLVFDEAKRIDVTQLRAGLVELARQWGVELPPFPPPGLAA